MSQRETRLFGDQFNEARFQQGQEAEEIVQSTLTDAFDAHNIVALEADEAFDNFAESKTIEQIMDYSGIDYVIDTFDAPAFGVNHRTHFKSNASRFDIRVDTGTSAPSEYEKLLKAGRWDIVPRYASRMKMPNDTVEWFRIVDLLEFVEAVETGELQKDFPWHGDGGVEAWMYDYDELRELGIVVDEINP